MAKFKFVEWLFFWLLEEAHFEFEWDDGNRTKSTTKHSVSIEETEQVFLLRQAIPLGVQISPHVPEERLGIVGPTFEGRLLHVVFTIREGKVRPISARTAKKTERGFYEAYIQREV